MLEYADRHGIVVIDETPAVGINSGLAAGAFGAEPFTTFSPETIGPATQEAHRQAIRELVARDKNHPCVVLWTIANEPESVTPEARAYFEPLAAETRRLDPSRPIGFANVMGATPDVDVLTDLFDVVMLNRYYGWYADAGDLPAAERALDAEIRAWTAAHGEADHLHRVRRRHVRRPAQRHADALDGGVPGRGARDVPPRLRPPRGRRRRADLELRRLRHRARGPARGRQQEGRLHPRAAAEGGGAHAAPALARLTVSGRGGAAPRSSGARNYLGYAAGDVANNLAFSMSSMFLLLYYTDVVGISAAAVGTLFLVVRVWDGVADSGGRPLVDRTSSRWGKFRPYLLFGSLPLLLLNVAIFTVPDLGGNGELVYAYVSYALFGLAYSLVNIPYGSLATAMTQDPDERSRLASVRTIGRRSRSSSSPSSSRR